MKRDMELIRKLLLHLEEHNEFPDAKSYGPPPLDVLRHVGLLVDAGLVSGIEVEESVAGIKGIVLMPEPRLTWAGHEFVDAARDEAIWHTAIDRTKKVSGSVGFAVLVKMLADLTLETIGMK